MESSKEKNIDRYLNFISGLFLLAFGIYVLVSGIFITKKSMIGDIVWYGSPGMFPIFIGVILIILSITLLITNFSKEKSIDLIIKDIVNLVDKNEIARTLLAIIILAIYVFVLIGNIPFYMATFVYLFVTMLIFKEKQFAVWKILIIAIIVTIVICLGFGKIANIPLP